MALYLYMDGVDDHLRSPQVAVDKIVMDFTFENNNPPSTLAYYLFDNRGGTPSGNYMVYVNNTGASLSKGSNITTLKLDGVTGTSFSVTPNTRYVVEASAQLVTPDANGIEFFLNYANQNTSRTKGKIYRITGYNSGLTVFDYDMTTGTVQDQSGNGNHATLTGGTWLDDGVGGGTEQTASASLVGIGSVSSSSLAIRNSSANLLGTGAFTASQLVVKNAQVDLVGLGTLAVNAEAISIVTASADLLGIGSISAVGQREVLGTLSLLGQGVFEVQTSDVTIITSGAYLTGTGQVIAEALKIINGSVNLLGDGSLNANGNRIANSQANLIGLGQLNTFGYKIVIADTSLVGQGVLTVIDGEPIIGTIKLKADRQLYVYLVANRDLYVKLKGGLDVTAENQSSIMYSGDTKNLDFELPGVDLNGSTLKWVLKKSATTIENILLKTESSGISTLEGLIRVKLDPADTLTLKGTHYHELELTDVVGNVSTLATGLITIKSSGV